MKTIKTGAPACGLYLRLGPVLALDRLIPDLRQIFFVANAAPYERNMHALEIRGDAKNEAFREQASLLFELAKVNGFACIWRGEAADAKALGAEGVIVDDPDCLAAAKKIFGEDGIVGLACGLSPDLAARAHDEGADFVSFGKDGKLPSAEMFRFWTTLSDKPALVEGPVSNDYCAYFIEAGASFIDATDYLWSHGKGVMQGTSNMLHAIELALEGRKTARQ